MKIGSKELRICRVVLILVLSSMGMGLAQDVQDNSVHALSLGLLIEDNALVEGRYGAEFAVEELNRKGGINGTPIKLFVRSMEGPWGMGSKKAVDLVFDKEVWALVGVLDGRNSHLVEQVAAKIDIPFVSAWASDPTLSKAYVPQFFNCVPNSDQQATVLLNEINTIRSYDRWILVSDESYDSRIAKEGIKRNEEYAKNPPFKELELSKRDGIENASKDLCDMIGTNEVEAVVMSCESATNLELIRSLRSAKLELPVYTGSDMLHEKTFSDVASKNLGEVYFVNVGIPESGTNIRTDFDQEFLLAHGYYPGPMASCAYDAIHVVARAIEQSDLDAKKLKKSLSITSYSGKTGAIEFDQFGNRKKLPKITPINSGNLAASKR